MRKLILKDSQVVMPSRIIRADILVEDDKIAKIAPQIEANGADEIDCHELVALSGLIDAHVHFRDPGMPQKATIYSESRAAILGGVTSFMDMPNTMPPTVDEASLNGKKATAARDSVANYAFYLGATPDNIEEVKKADPKSVAGIKVYMGSTTGNLLLDDESILHKMFKAAPMMVTAHCEDNEIIAAKQKAAQKMYGDNIPFNMHPVIRNRDCCIKSSKLAIQTALDTGAKLHIMHLSTKEEVEILNYFAKDPLERRQISGEACIPHLFFSESDYSRLQGFLKCNPAVKYEFDRKALIKGIKRGIITTVGTDHAPHEISVKTGSYLKCASGVTSVQYSLLALLDLWKRGELTLEEVVKVSSTNVAKRFNLTDRGTIEEGKKADIVLINPIKSHTVTASDIKSLCGWSPFINHTFRCSIAHTVVSGVLKVKDGKIVSDESGEALSFDR
ncbi:dihydroorotase [Succinatimonas hippei]|uniref:dihydroorotase n=1 Tax=Succinatimonas hippei TaxID=626938 RepID=UPI002011D14B|nr:dihydroorotase [Succinatimonas hippei]MCL1602921.1 dihydroorotase [Succinatimonas hippei]